MSISTKITGSLQAITLKKYEPVILLPLFCMMEEQDTPKQPINDELSADAIVQDSSISPSETKTPDMEVHHHPDLHHKRKNFKEYFLEFLMIFLAVTMGFIAENFRESMSAKSYIDLIIRKARYSNRYY